jgi:ABC-type multidrug transport system fused ATPase/permease subunit
LFIIPASVFGFIYRRLAIGYLNTGRDLRRMESNTRSPIFANFGELLEGIVTVRAFSAERRFLEFHTNKIDLTNKVRLHPFRRLVTGLCRMADVVHVLDDEPVAVAPV